MKDLEIGYIYPTTMYHESLSRVMNSKADRFNQFWNSFVICSLFFDKLTIPIKGILDDPLFHDLFKKKETEISQFTELISPIMIGNDSQSIMDAAEELIDRKHHLHFKGDMSSQISEMAEKLENPGFKKKRVDKLEFHKTYYRELLQFLSHFNREGLEKDNKVLLKGELTEVIKRIKDSRPHTWSDTDYFGSSNAKTAIAESVEAKEITGDTQKVLIDIVNSFWNYILQKLGKLNVNLPDFSLELFNVFHMIDSEDVKKHNNTKFLSSQELLQHEFALKNRLNIPIFEIPSCEKMTLKDLISLKNSEPIVLYRKLIGEIRKSMPNPSRQIDQKINEIENIYNEYLSSYMDKQSKLLNPGNKFKIIEKLLKKKFNFSWIKKYHDWIDKAGLASNIINIGEIALTAISGTMVSVWPIVMAIPAICEFTTKWKSEDLMLPQIDEQPVYPYYYNPVIGTITKTQTLSDKTRHSRQ